MKTKNILNSYTEELVQDLILQFSSTKRGKLAITEEEFEEDSKEFFNEFKKIIKNKGKK